MLLSYQALRFVWNRYFWPQRLVGLERLVTVFALARHVYLSGPLLLQPAACYTRSQVACRSRQTDNYRHGRQSFHHSGWSSTSIWRIFHSRWPTSFHHLRQLTVRLRCEQAEVHQAQSSVRAASPSYLSTTPNQEWNTRGNVGKECLQGSKQQYPLGGRLV